MTDISTLIEHLGLAGAFGVNYALRPHKFVDRRIFIEILNRFSNYQSLDGYAYVGLGSFALEDHKLMNSMLGIRKLISLEVDHDVFKRQKFNNPLWCIFPTLYSTSDFLSKKQTVLREASVNDDAPLVVWFDMTDRDPIRTQLESFRHLIEGGEIGDVIRITVDVDEKTFGRQGDVPNESLDELQDRRFGAVREQLGNQLKPGANLADIASPIALAKLVLYAFQLIAEEALASSRDRVFAPLSLTTYADGHRMLSITGTLVASTGEVECRKKMALDNVVGAAQDWNGLTPIIIPQLTIWEKLVLDREIHTKTSNALANEWDFKLHEVIGTTELLEGYKEFQRHYPTFRHVVL